MRIFIFRDLLARVMLREGRRVVGGAYHGQLANLYLHGCTPHSYVVVKSGENTKDMLGSRGHSDSGGLSGGPSGFKKYLQKVLSEMSEYILTITSYQTVDL